MEEYWVNVYEQHYKDIYKLTKNETKMEAIIRGAELEDIELYYGDYLGMVQYRLHVREFDTCEAKELYLKMKYGKPVKYYWNYEKLKPLLEYGKSSMHEHMGFT